MKLCMQADGLPVHPQDGCLLLLRQRLHGFVIHALNTFEFDLVDDIATGLTTAFLAFAACRYLVSE